MTSLLKRIFGALGALLVLTIPVMAYATPAHCSSGPSGFCVDGGFFGAGGQLDASSANYQAKLSAGEVGIGNINSASFQANAGFNTTSEPFLEFSVTAANTNLGVLTTATTGRTTGTFQIRTYLSSGYVIQNASDPPKNSSYFLSALAAPTASSAGTEQFGINLVANTSPATFGANPVQIPDNTFSFGTVASGYNTPNLYKYVKNDVVATSAQSTGTTAYTVSYIYNVDTLTRGGTYTFNHVLVATATY